MHQGRSMGGGGVWDPAAQGYLQQTGGDLQWYRGNFTVPWKSHGAQQAVVPPRKSLVWHWWHCLGRSLAADRCKWPRRVAVQVHEGWFWGTRLTLTYTNSGESQALCSDREHLCPGQQNTWSPSWEDPCAAPLWGYSQGWACTAGMELTPGLTGAHVGFTWPKCFPGESHHPIPAAGDCHPARCRVPSASSGSRCWLHVKLRDALSSTCYLEVLRWMQSFQEVYLSHLRGGEEGRRLITAWRWTCGPNGGVCSSWRLGIVPREPHPSGEELFLSADRQLSPGDSFATMGIPWLQAARDKGLPSPSHPACFQGSYGKRCHHHMAVGRDNSRDSDSSLGEG